MATAKPRATHTGQARWSSGRAPPSAVPPTIPLVPDVETFLTVIGRGLRQHAAKFPTWEALFSLTTDQLRELGIEPPRTRKYLLRWRRRFCEGRFGTGGDLKYVENGTAELKVLEVKDDPLNTHMRVVNVPPRKDVKDVPREELVLVKGYSVSDKAKVTGPYALPLKGGGATVSVTEGMWEDVRGHKVDGGERRQAEIRFKRRVAERRALREKQGFY